ncbi:hypothetical protein E2C01_040751 [Portunus trituberculatus]|uniref:Uncharacterized protein n=1 Tax=Portunus trituberculatus TaxID=210409 RepID=A0A5B7FQ21_PORTR|nr:hypothetical protein [Portunus trituberculatus]
MGRTRAFISWSLRPVAKSLKQNSRVRADFTRTTRWVTWLVYPIEDTDSPRSEPLGLNPTSSPSTSSWAGFLVARGMTVNLAMLVLILHSLSKALMRLAQGRCILDKNSLKTSYREMALEPFPLLEH